jgi:hypothetical protein
VESHAERLIDQESGRKHLGLVHAVTLEGLVGAIPMAVERRDAREISKASGAAIQRPVREAGIRSHMTKCDVGNGLAKCSRPVRQGQTRF